MKNLCATFACIVLGATATLAADLPLRNAPIRAMPLALFTWTGFYVGAQIGAGWQRDRLTELDSCTPCSADTASGRSAGIIGGVRAGANWQTGAFVFGVEADFERTNLRLRTLYPASAPDAFSSHVDWQGSVRGRLGYALDRVLVYLTGGVAFADISHGYDRFDPVPGSPGVYTLGATQSTSRVRTGWTLGSGLEYALSTSWSANIEYRYTDFGHAA
ncbi:MAG: Porin, partial [Hyphomicrobiales bacterium]|nr:Porin [Hyphomicrobiales bacterium]